MYIEVNIESNALGTQARGKRQNRSATMKHLKNVSQKSLPILAESKKDSDHIVGPFDFLKKTDPID